MKVFVQLLINKVCAFFFLLYRKIHLLLIKDCVQGDTMQSGELVVVGADQVVIDLGARPPGGVIVEFHDHHHIHVPCNPKHHDELRYEIKNIHHHHPHDKRHDHCAHEDKYLLTIQWSVTGVRVINWVVYY